MMRHHQPDDADPLGRWLAAEGAREATEADVALAALLRHAASPGPRAGFADRVMRAVAAERALQQVTPSFDWLRWAAVVALVIVGLAAVASSRLAGSVLAGIDLAALPALAAGAAAGLAETLARAFALWQRLAGFGAPVGRALASPSLLAPLGALVVVSSLALGSLVRLAERGTGVHHVLPR